MKVLILTTDTNHHNFFIYKLLLHYPDISVIIESDIVKPKYPTFHKFETMRDDFENNLWREILEFPLKKLCSNYQITSNINNLEIINKIKYSNFDVCLVFGTRKINNDLIAALPKNSFNLHGGDPQHYRGLDSHLWSIWHRDVNGLKVCIHRLDSKLDHGEIFQLEDLDIKSIDSVFQLRSINTQKCVDISLLLLNNLDKKLKLSALHKKVSVDTIHLCLMF